MLSGGFVKFTGFLSYTILLPQGGKTFCGAQFYLMGLLVLLSMCSCIGPGRGDGWSYPGWLAVF